MKAWLSGIEHLSREGLTPCAKVFFAGCNAALGCRDEHGPAFETPVEAVVDEIDGAGLARNVLFTGGEPAAQEKPLREMAGLFRERNFGVLLHTGGTRHSVVADLSAKKAIDGLVLEVNSPTMAADKRVLAALAGAARHGVETTVLFPAAAGLNDRAESVRSVADALRGAERFVLKQYDPTHGHADAIFSRRAVVPHWRLHELAREAKPFFRDVRVRTRGFGEEAA